MALTDVPENQITITDITNDIREKISQVVELAEIRLHEIRNTVREYSRATIAAELGSDAADMLLVYTKLKEAIEIAKQITVEDLPS